MKYRGLGVDDSLQYLKRRRSCSNVNPSFVSQLRDYEKQLKDERLKAIERKEPAPSYPQDLIGIPMEQGQRPPGPQGPQRPPRSLGPQPKPEPADSNDLQMPAKRPLAPIGPSLPISQTPSENTSSSSSKQLGNRKQQRIE